MGGKDEELRARESRTLLPKIWLANLDEFSIALPRIYVPPLAPNDLSPFVQKYYAWLLTGEWESVPLYVALDPIAIIPRILHKSFDTTKEHKVL